MGPCASSTIRPRPALRRAARALVLAAPAAALGCLSQREEALPLSAPAAESVRYEVLKRDPRTGLDQRVIPEVELGAVRAVRLDMKWSNFTYSFVPASVARELGAQTLETLDLGRIAPAVPAELEVMHGMNPGCQRVFDVVRIDVVDLGVGPAFGPVRALVLDDSNASFGLIGNDWTSFRCGRLAFHYVGTVPDHPCGKVEWKDEAVKRRAGG